MGSDPARRARSLPQRRAAQRYPNAAPDDEADPFCDDGVHPSPEGYAVIAEGMVEHIAALIRAEGRRS